MQARHCQCVGSAVATSGFGRLSYTMSRHASWDCLVGPLLGTLSMGAEHGSEEGQGNGGFHADADVDAAWGYSEREASIVGGSATQRHSGPWRELGFRALVAEILWHGGSAGDAWLTSASHQVAQVLLTLPYSFAQLGYASGIIFQLFYGLVGCWTCFCVASLYAEHRFRQQRDGVTLENHTVQWFEVLDELLGRRWKVAGLLVNCTFLITAATIQIIACGSTVYLINDKLDKRTWTYVFGAGCMLSVFIPTLHNFRVWSLTGLLMTTYTAWYMTIAALVHGQKPGPVKHTGPQSLVPFFTGATNILYTFGGHATTVEVMDSMWRPQKFKWVYVLSTLYVFTLTLPSAISVYWAFGDSMASMPNALSALPRTPFRDAAVILMLIHQFFTFALISIPIYTMWEKLLGIHTSMANKFLLRVAIRLPVGLFIWFMALAIPFFGPINSAVGATLVTFGVYIIPAAAYNAFYSSPSARENAMEKPPFFIPSWRAIFVLNTFIVIWVFIVGFGLGCWSSISNFIKLVHTFGLFAKCYECPVKY